MGIFFFINLYKYKEIKKKKKKAFNIKKVDPTSIQKISLNFKVKEF